MLRRRRIRRSLLVALALVTLVAALFADSRDALSGAELASVNLRMDLRGGHAPPDDILIVGIDDVSLDELEVTPPFPRRYHARVIDRLRRAGVRAIVYDVEFVNETNEDDDYALLDALDRADRIALPTSAHERDRQPAILGGAAELRKEGGRVGTTATFLEDPDGQLRRFRYERRGINAHVVEAAAAVTGRLPDRGDFHDGVAWIDFHGERGTFPAVSFSRVMRGQVPDSRLRGKVVVVGGTDPILQDVHATPPDGRLMAGPEIVANALSSVLSGLPLRVAPGWIGPLLIALFALLPPAVTLRWSALRALAAAAAMAVGLLVAAQIAFERGRIVEIVVPLLTLVVAAGGALAIDYLTELRERRRLRTVFGRFVPEQVVDTVIDRTDEDLRLGGREIRATVLFCDLRGFTAFAEGRSAEHVIGVLNRYLGEVSEAVRAHGGTIVAYMGDGVMAVFGAPVESETHAADALAAAREIANGRIEAVNRWIREHGHGDGFAVGVGVATGDVLSGNVGAEWRLEYTAVGDTTNVAAKVQAATKEAGTAVLVTDETAKAVGQAGLERFGEVTLPGRSSPTVLWTPSRGQSLPPLLDD